MQGAGNDFVVINGVTQRLNLSRRQLRWLADRRFGVGADQLLLVEAPNAKQLSAHPDLDFVYRIFNADGGEVEQCGNGARCFVKFVRDQGLTSKKRIRVLTAGGVIEPELLNDGNVRVDMGSPDFALAASHFNGEGLAREQFGQAELFVLPIDEALPTAIWPKLGVVSMGNPHAVQIVVDVELAPVLTTGAKIQSHPRFSQGVNAGFLQVLSRTEGRLRVFERGTGETLACGSGACAAAVLGIRMGLFDPEVTLHARGGSLKLAWTGESVWMTGPAETVFSTQIELPIK
jgi:diaminopimelate epimerase